MKEVTHEDWMKNPTPRMMWVWDDVKHIKQKRKVICIVNRPDYPVVALSTDGRETNLFMHCAEIEGSKTRRMTNQELAWWLTEKPYREIKDDGWIFSRYYYIEENQFQEVKDDIFIREDGGEWREPLVETDEYKDYLESEKAYNDGV